MWQPCFLSCLRFIGKFGWYCLLSYFAYIIEFSLPHIEINWNVGNTCSVLETFLNPSMSAVFSFKIAVCLLICLPKDPFTLVKGKCMIFIPICTHTCTLYPRPLKFQRDCLQLFEFVLLSPLCLSWHSTWVLLWVFSWLLSVWGTRYWHFCYVNVTAEKPTANWNVATAEDTTSVWLCVNTVG